MNFLSFLSLKPQSITLSKAFPVSRKLRSSHTNTKICNLIRQYKTEKEYIKLPLFLSGNIFTNSHIWDYFSIIGHFSFKPAWWGVFIYLIVFTEREKNVVTETWKSIINPTEWWWWQNAFKVTRKKEHGFLCSHNALISLISQLYHKPRKSNHMWSLGQVLAFNKEGLKSVLEVCSE